MNKKLSKEELKMLTLDLKDPDAIVMYIISFYEEKNIKTEKDLIRKLTKEKPLIKAIKLQSSKVL